MFFPFFMRIFFCLFGGLLWFHIMSAIILWYYLTPVRMIHMKNSRNNSWWECVKKTETLYIVRRNVKWFSAYWKLYIKILNVGQSNDPAIILLGIHPKNVKALIGRDICNLIFNAALFTTANFWKQPKCTMTDDWNKMWYT